MFIHHTKFAPVAICSQKQCHIPGTAAVQGERASVADGRKGNNVRLASGHHRIMGATREALVMMVLGKGDTNH